MGRFGIFRLGCCCPSPLSRRCSATRIGIGLFLAAFALCSIAPSVEAVDLELNTVDDALPDFTKMDIEELAKQDITVRERLRGTRRLTLQDGIMGGHIHEAGEWMIGYRYRFTEMDGNRVGGNRVSTADVFGQGFTVSPTRMTMQTQMLHAMYAPSDKVTWMVMAPFKQLAMDHVTAGGTKFTTRSEGIGDVGLSGFYTFFDDERKVYSGRPEPRGDGAAQRDCWLNSRDELRQAYAGLTMYFPTGSIDERDATPLNPNDKLPYPMQLGSGTFDLEPSLAYFGVTERWAWGLNARMLFRLGRNNNGYSLGDRFSGSAWASRKLSDRFALEMRLDETIWGDVDGADPELNPLIVPTARPDLRGGNRLDVWLGLTYYMPEGTFEGNRLHIEFGVPLDQSLNGPQLETDWLAQASWSWTY